MPEQGAVLIAQQVRHALVDVGDEPAVVGDPDALLGRVHQLLEALLALLQGPGPILQPALPRLEGGRVLERCSDEAAEQPERLGVAGAEGGGPGGEQLEDAEDPLVVPEREGEHRADALLVVRLVADPGVGKDVVRPLQLAGADAESRQAALQREPGALHADQELGDELLALEPLEHDARGAGEGAAPLGDHPHHRGGVESRRRHRLLDLDHSLEQLGVEPHLLLGELAFGDIELGAEVADLAAALVAERLPGAGAPADLPRGRDHPVFLVPERPTPGQPRPFRQQRGPVVRMDVLQELLVAQVLDHLARETLERGVREREPEVHVIGDDAFAHAGGDGPELARGHGRFALRAAAAAALEPVGDHQPEHRQGGGGQERGGGDAVQQAGEGRDHECDPSDGRWGRRSARSERAPKIYPSEGAVEEVTDRPAGAATAADGAQSGRTASSGSPRVWRTVRSSRSRENGFSRNRVPGWSSRIRPIDASLLPEM